jgi:hypothetical protein
MDTDQTPPPEPNHDPVQTTKGGCQQDACSRSVTTPRTDAFWQLLYDEKYTTRHRLDKAICYAKKLERDLREAGDLLAQIMRDEVNHQDEAEKWLRVYAPQHLFPENVEHMHPYQRGRASITGWRL